MDKSKIDRINELYKKSKEQGLSEEESLEQQTLRKEYLDSIKANFKKTLSSIEYTD